MPQVVYDIVPAALEDLAAVAHIEQQCFVSQPWSLTAFVQAWHNPDFWFWVAKAQSAVVGYLVCQVTRHEAELHNIAVAPLHRRKGMASQLIAALKKQLIEKKVGEIFLMVRVSNRQAQNLYQKFGFHKIGVRPKYYRDSVEDGWVYQ